MKKLLLFLLLAGSVLAFGQEQKLVTVEARGMGVSPDAATRDALSQAVQQAAGAIVDSQTLMKNDEIMQEKILTASNAIVKKYDVVVPVKKNRNGLYEIRIRAEVEQNLLRQKLIEQKIIEGKVEGTQNIWAEIVTQEKNQVDMETMIENSISKIDVRKYLQFNIIGVNRKMGNEAKLYMRPLPNNRKIYVKAGLVCFFDSARFYEECVKPIAKIFNELPFKTKHQFIRQGDSSTIEYEIGLAYNSSEKLIPVASSRVFEYDHCSRVLQCAEHSKHNQCTILLNVTPRYRAGNQRFVCFSYEPAGDRPYYRGDEATEKLFGGLSAALCLLDRGGNEIRRMEYKFGDTNGAGKEFLGAGILKDSKTITISPEFFMGSWGGRGYCSNVVILPLSAIIDVDDLKDIKSFKLEVSRGR